MLHLFGDYTHPDTTKFEDEQPEEMIHRGYIL
jgi:hypothetical protein